MKVERVGDNARITIYDIDGSASVAATVACWRWERVLRIFWPPPVQLCPNCDGTGWVPPQPEGECRFCAGLGSVVAAARREDQP